MSRLGAVLFGLAAACTAPTVTAPGSAPRPRTSAQPPALPAELGWRPTASSPTPGWPSDPTLQSLARICGEYDAALAEVASQIARRQAHRQPAFDGLDLDLVLRSTGVPYVWPRTWSLEGGTLDVHQAAERFSRWLAQRDDGGVRRCGLYRAIDGSGRHVIAAVVVHALADLTRPLPAQARTGQWLELEATMLVGVASAKLVVLGPTLAPFAVPTSVQGNRVRARFRVDRPGRWAVQLLAVVDSGVRPVLETLVHVDLVPPDSPSSRDGSFDLEALGTSDPVVSLVGAINQARIFSGLRPLSLDSRLSLVASRHAEWMSKRGQLGHESEQGDPSVRVRAVIPESLGEGENVACARTLERAHRVLWASPSHRGNLLNRSYDVVGVGVARDESGLLWVSEVFSDLNGF